MANPLTWTGSLLAGAGLMYLLDPGSGKRRRARLRDKAVHAGGAAGEAIGTTSRDLRNRAAGVAAQARALVRGEEVPDRVLEERVRSRLGRAVSHPGSIEVTARRGAVTSDTAMVTTKHVVQAKIAVQKFCAISLGY